MAGGSFEESAAAAPVEAGGTICDAGNWFEISEAP
jgi:hypothetical protein